MATPRNFLRMPDIPRRRRSARQALAMIPGSDEVITIEANPISRRYSMDSWSPGPSPDELVIQSRGRRSTIVWSPEKNRTDALFRDHTPVKSPSKSQSRMQSKNTPRKRLHLEDNDIDKIIPEKMQKISLNKQFNGNLVNGLRGLSQDQLVNMIMDLVSMEDNNLFSPTDSLRDLILKKMPIADIEPLKEKLTFLRTVIYASMVSSSMDESAYNRASMHLENYEKTVKEQGYNLLESQHWTAVMQYFFAAWTITKDLPEWKNRGTQSTTQKCYKSLTNLCIQALNNGCFTESTMKSYKEQLLPMIEDYRDIEHCLHLANEKD